MCEHFRHRFSKAHQLRNWYGSSYERLYTVPFRRKAKDKSKHKKFPPRARVSNNGKKGNTMSREVNIIFSTSRQKWANIPWEGVFIGFIFLSSKT